MPKSERQSEPNSSAKKRKKSPVAKKAVKRKIKQADKAKSPSKTALKKVKRTNKLYNREIEVFTSIKITKDNAKPAKTAPTRKVRGKGKANYDISGGKKTPVTKWIVRKRPNENQTELK